jgi:hypothetical protein
MLHFPQLFMSLRRVSLPLAVLGIILSASAQPTVPPAAAKSAKSALLIGIWTYEHPPADIAVPPGAPRTGRYEPVLVYRSLKGPEYDIKDMKDLLTSEKFAFPDDVQHIHFLRDKEATHDAILQAMQKYLVDAPASGDTVVLYISSHGSVRVDPKGHGQVFDLDGTGRNPTYLENTIVPYDWYLGADDIFSRDLRHIFKQAADKGVHVTAIFDSCHSGSLARGAESPAIVPRDFDFDPRPMPADRFSSETAGTLPQNHPDAPTLILSAAQKDQTAADVQNATPPYGLFTHSLIETLQALPANRPASDVFRSLQIAMELAPAALRQQPELDTAATRKKQPLFGGEAGADPANAAVVSVDSAGAVLDIGSASDIGVGSEFTLVTAINGVRPVLRVTEPIGFARSRAIVASPDGATVKAKDIAQLTKWVPAERPILNVYAMPSNLAAAQIEKDLSTIRAASFKLIADPSNESWTQHVFWDGTKWIAQPVTTRTPAGQVKVEKPVILGAVLTASALKKLPAASIVWFDVPLPKEFGAALLPPVPEGQPPRAAAATNDRSQAVYTLAGAPTATGAQYAWFKRTELDDGVRAPKDIAPGCNPNSSFPLRTDWILSAAANSTGQALTDLAVQLARLNGWLHLESSSLSGQTGFPYQLVLRRLPEQQDVSEGGFTYPGKYEMDLVATSHSSASPRWVYILGISCQGQGTLLWPYEGAPPAMFPSDKGKLDRIPLPGDPIDMQPPYGSDTYLLLTTTTQISNPSALEFKGVVTKNANSKAPKDPLEDLLFSTSLGSRAGGRPTPQNWSVQALRLESREQAPQEKPSK